jgi:hypothetical protein
MPHGIAMQAAPVTNQTQNYTKSSMGTPKGALAFLSQVTTLNSDVLDFTMSMGATDVDASNGCMAFAGSEDNVNPSDSRCIQQSDELLRLATEGTDAANEQANNNDTVTDGVQLDWVATSVARQCALLMFNEGIANFDVRYQNLNGTGTTVVNVGFQPDLVLWLSAAGSDEFGTPDAQLSVSAHHRVSGNYASCGVIHNDADGTPSSAHRFATGEMIGNVNITNGNPFNEFTLGSFTGTGFTATKVSGTAAKEYIQVCIKMDTGYDCAVGNFAAPTSTGITEVVSGLSFTPQLAMFFGGARTAVGGDANAGSFHIGAVTNGDEFSIGGFSEDLDTSTSTNTGSHMRNDSCVYSPNNAGTVESKAAFDSFGDGTIDLNFSTADTAVQIGYLAIGNSPDPIVIPVPAGPEY